MREIFDVQILRGLRWAELLVDSPLGATSSTVPDDALDSVRAGVRADWMKPVRKRMSPAIDCAPIDVQLPKDVSIPTTSGPSACVSDARWTASSEASSCWS